MDEEKQAQQEETSPEVEEEQAEGSDLNMIEQAEAEAKEEKKAPTLWENTVHSIQAQRERIEDQDGVTFHSGFESFSVLQKALEDKTDVEKETKNVVKDLWDAVKAEDNTLAASYLKEIERVARDSAMAWIRVAAICQKAEASL